MRCILSNVSAQIQNLHTSNLVFSEKICENAAKLENLRPTNWCVVAHTAGSTCSGMCKTYVQWYLWHLHEKFHLVFSCGNLNFWNESTFVKTQIMPKLNSMADKYVEISISFIMYSALNYLHNLNNNKKSKSLYVDILWIS